MRERFIDSAVRDHWGGLWETQGALGVVELLAE